MTQPIQPSPVTPLENIQRGTVFALAIIPAGIIVWDVLWSIGFIASIVAFGVAAGAVWLYRRGSGGVVSRQGAVRIVVITILTLVLAFFGGMVTDALVGYSQAIGTNWVEAITSQRFWTVFWNVVGDGAYFSSIALPLLLAVLFAFLGCFRVLRNALKSTNAQAQADAAAGYQPSPYVPPTAAGQQLPPLAPGQVSPPATTPPATPPAATGRTILNGEPLPPTKD
jgi:hypothetical protein